MEHTSMISTASSSSFSHRKHKKYLQDSLFRSLNSNSLQYTELSNGRLKGYNVLFIFKRPVL